MLAPALLRTEGHLDASSLDGEARPLALRSRRPNRTEAIVAVPRAPWGTQSRGDSGLEVLPTAVVDDAELPAPALFRRPPSAPAMPTDPGRLRQLRTSAASASELHLGVVQEACPWRSTWALAPPLSAVAPEPRGEAPLGVKEAPASFCRPCVGEALRGEAFGVAPRGDTPAARGVRDALGLRVPEQTALGVLPPFRELRLLHKTSGGGSLGEVLLGKAPPVWTPPPPVGTLARGVRLLPSFSFRGLPRKMSGGGVTLRLSRTLR